MKKFEVNYSIAGVPTSLPLKLTAKAEKKEDVDQELVYNTSLAPIIKLKTKDDVTVHSVNEIKE